MSDDPTGEDETQTLRSFFESAPTMMGVAEVEGDDIRHIHDNQAAGAFFGSPPAAMRGRLASELGVPRESIQLWVDHYRQAEATRAPVRFEYHHETPRETRRLAVTVSLLGKNRQGHSRFSYIVQDITKMWQAEQELREAKVLLEQRVRERTAELQVQSDALENSLNGFDVVNAEGKFVYANRAYLRMWGYGSLQEVLDTSPASHCADPSVPEKIIRALKEKGECETEFLARRKDGSTFDVYMWARLAHDSQGREIYPTTSIDITEKKRAEAVARAEQHRLMAVILNSPSALSIKSKEGRYLVANPNFKRLLGLDPASMVGKTDFELFPPETALALRKSDERVFETKERLSVEETLPAADGQLRVFMSHKFPILDRDGRLESVCSISLDITERRRDEERLTASELRLRLALEAASMGVYERDLLTGKVTWSSQARRLLGQEPGKLEESFEAFFERIHPADRERFQEEAVRAVREGRSVNIDYRFTRPDGQTIWLHAYGKAVADASGRPTRALGVLQDVTARKRTEEALKDREEALRLERARLHSLLLQAPAIFSVTRGPAHVFEIFNLEARKTVGGRDCTGLSIQQALPELEGRGFYEALDTVYRTGEPLHLKESPADLVQPDGSTRRYYFNVVYHPWRDPEGQIAGIMNVSLDVTEQVLARKRIEQAEAELRILADSIPQLVWMATADGNVFWYNRRWYEYTGTTPREMEGWGWQRVQDPRELPEVLRRWQHSLATGEPFDMVFPLRGADGKFRRFLTRVHPVRDEGGQTIRWFGTNTDIESEIQYKENLEAALRARDEFLSIASHELRTPLTSLTLQVQGTRRSLARGEPEALSPERTSKLLEQIEKQVRRLARLVDDMLDIARIRAGKLALQLQEVDLCALVREVTDRLRPQLFEAGGAPPVLALCESARGHWDPMRVEQVVTNLLTNAMRYGQGKPVRIGVELLGQSVRLSVQDQGIGIAREHQDRIFNRFERAVSAEEISGLGLGLFISRQIVELHGGRIWVVSEPGQGATFLVELPLHQHSAGGLPGQ